MWPDINFEFYPPTAVEIFWTMTAVFTAVGLLGLWIITDTLRNRREKIARLHRIARAQSAERGLTPAESQLLDDIVVEFGDFPGPRSFESAVEKFLAGGIAPDVIHSLRTKLGFSSREGRALASTRECERGIDVTFGDAGHLWSAVTFDVTETDLVLRVGMETARALSRGAEVTLSFWRENDARYYFRTRVTEVSLGPVPLVHVAHPADFERYQDREFVRADVDWKINVKRLSADEYHRAVAGTLHADDIRETTARVIDISEGGMRLKDAALEVKNRIVAELPIGLLVVAKVIAIGGDGIRCEFVNLSMSERDKVHRAILTERRKRGLV